ncbi:MAG: hypothetical protein EXS08_01835 [Planctomycetes bacterium]|nr:hypothetical protein [Planctomycetota bacterium]
MSPRPFPAWLAGLALCALAACTTPAPRIPFARGGWHATAIAGERASNDRFHGSYSTTGIELTTLMPGTGGWGWDVSYRTGDTEGTDGYRITNPGGRSNGKRWITVDNERHSRIQELGLGVRQVFRPDSRLQPYVGAGTSFFKTHNSDHYTGFDDDLDVNGNQKAVDQRKHFQTCAVGLYVSTGFVWNVLRDQVREDTEFVVDVGLRGLIGDEFSFVELALGFGFGR